MKKTFLLLCFLSLLVVSGRADEGMWIPMLLKKYNIEDMQQKGFKLTAEDVYAINQASLKDAVIGFATENSPFRHFCTGEIISNDGLVLTNHHCVYGMIQSHTTLENNYLRDGFWARERKEELANPGITASVLVRMEDVTETVLACLSDEMSEEEREVAIRKVSQELEKKAVEGTNLKANIKAYFNGNQFFMSVFKIYKDIRLVGAPPSAIGKFGGDTDNWTWPRHTGDFSLIRIYADEKNEPAEFAQSNRPYTPGSFFKLSTRELKEGDFTMVFGYPGTTNEYLPSFAIEQIVELENPHKVAIRTAKLEVIKNAMESDELLRIKYSAKAASVSNAWKKWIGEIKGLKRFNVVEEKQRLESNFRQWAANTRYKEVVEQYKQLYEQRKTYILAHIYLSEAGRSGAEVIGFASSLSKNILSYVEATDKNELKGRLKQMVAEFYKNYDAATDRKILEKMLDLYNSNLIPSQIPQSVKDAASKGDYEAYSRDLFAKSVFTDRKKLDAFIDKLNAKSYKKLGKDPVYQLVRSIEDYNTYNILPELRRITNEITRLNRFWMAGLMEMQPEKNFFADANSSLRVSYGKIGGYTPADGARFSHYTTLRGIMEKDNPEIYDYDVPQKLKDLYRTKDFGSYTQNGEVPVCFVASNHTTGGNSGSPVLNAEGHLIGINFDRAWEGVMSDLAYSPEICRNIAVDIRYVLFIIDKFAGAGYLLDEMEIVRE